MGELEGAGEEVAQLLLRRQLLAEHRRQRGGGQLRIVEVRQLEKMQLLLRFRYAPYLNFFIHIYFHSFSIEIAKLLFALENALLLSIPEAAGW